MKTYNTNYLLLNTEKGKTERNSTYYRINAADKTTGEVVTAFYFGYTKPKAVMEIKQHISKEGTAYNIAEIQPHQCRNKLGRFISAKR